MGVLSCLGGDLHSYSALELFSVIEYKVNVISYEENNKVSVINNTAWHYFGLRL